jgi:succinate-acetate transporter protein
VKTATEIPDCSEVMCIVLLALGLFWVFLVPIVVVDLVDALGAALAFALAASTTFALLVLVVTLVPTLRRAVSLATARVARYVLAALALPLFVADAFGPAVF